MKLVIEIDKVAYDLLTGKIETANIDLFSTLIQAVQNGTPLPKGHGRLMILSEDRLKENQINLDFSCQKWISEVGLHNATVKIIEADKENKE